MAGVIIPREGGLAIALTEKLEDMVTIVFLPLVSMNAVRRVKCSYLWVPVLYTFWFKN